MLNKVQIARPTDGWSMAVDGWPFTSVDSLYSFLQSVYSLLVYSVHLTALGVYHFSLNQSTCRFIIKSISWFKNDWILTINWRKWDQHNYVIKRTSSYTLNTIWFLSNSLRFIFSYCWIYCKNKNKHYVTSNHKTSYILWFQLHSWASINENYKKLKSLKDT